MRLLGHLSKKYAMQTNSVHAQHTVCSTKASSSLSSAMDSLSRGGIRSDSLAILILFLRASSSDCRVDSCEVSSDFSLPHSVLSQSSSCWISFKLSCSRMHSWRIRFCSSVSLSPVGAGSSDQRKNSHC